MSLLGEGSSRVSNAVWSGKESVEGKAPEEVESLKSAEDVAAGNNAGRGGEGGGEKEGAEFGGEEAFVFEDLRAVAGNFTGLDGFVVFGVLVGGLSLDFEGERVCL